MFSYYTTSIKPVAKPNQHVTKEVNIPRGSNARAISKILKSEKLIADDLVFLVYCRINNKAGFKAGKYELSNTMSVDQIADKLVTGKAIIDTVRFTIPEGFEIRQIVDKLVELGIADREALISALESHDYDYEFLKDLPKRKYRLEGYLFPDTYEVYRNTKAQDIVDKMLKRFDEVFNEKLRKRAKELDMTIDKVINLASIVEREAKLDKDRGLIAGVFYNRLRKKMLLQSDATVQYVFKERKEVVLYKDLEVDSPYNTYKYAGLPPGPIASPGLKSIEATLYPEDSDFLYFFAKKDGTNVFTKTYSDHINEQNKIKKANK